MTFIRRSALAFADSYEDFIQPISDAVADAEEVFARIDNLRMQLRAAIESNPDVLGIEHYEDLSAACDNAEFSEGGMVRYLTDKERERRDDEKAAAVEYSGRVEREYRI